VIFALRTAGDPLGPASAVRDAVKRADPRVPVTKVKTQRALIDGSINQEVTFARLGTAFALLALTMACVGLYGTMSYGVARRTSEIGIRMALGAERRRIVWMVLREVIALRVFGLALGLAAVYETTEFVKSFLFGLKPNDPWALGVSVS